MNSEPTGSGSAADILAEATKLHQEGRLALAEEMYRSVLEADRANADAMHNLGVVGYQTDRYQLALDLIRSAIALRPDVADFHWSLGLTYRALQRPAEMFDACRRSVALSPVTLRMVGLAEELLHANANREAADYYRKALAGEPNDGRALTGLGEALRRIGALGDARQALEQALRLDPTNATANINLGATLYDQGDFAGAEAAFLRTIEINPSHGGAYSNLGEALRRAGRLRDALPYSERAALLWPQDPAMHHNLGLLRRELGDLAGAEACFRQSVAVAPNFANGWASVGDLMRDCGRLKEAEDAYQEAIRLHPHYLFHNNLGFVLTEAGRREEAAAAFAEALRINPDCVEALCNLGGVLLRLGRPAEAAQQCRKAIRLQPDHPESHSNLGNALRDLGLLGESAVECEAAIRLKPDFHGAHNNLGSVLLDIGRPDDAIKCFHEAIRLKPDSVEALSNLGNALQKLGRLTEAETVVRDALRIDPGYYLAHNNLGVILLGGGRPDEAVISFREAFRLNAGYVTAHSNVIFALDLAVTATAAEQQEERRRWYERSARHYAPKAPRWENDTDPERPIRVGYVSADFRRTSAAYSFVGVLRRHDSRKVRVFCYSNSPPQRDDDVTASIREKAEEWRAIYGQSDEQTAAQIRADRIDILVDLSGHMQGQRLLVFARKPAPIQVSAWGNATGTGMATIDYLFADPITAPQEIRRFFAERIVDLPCLTAFELFETGPASKRSRRSDSDPVTFACFNRLAKITQATIDLLARVLVAAPRSRLLLKGDFLGDDGVQSRIRAAMLARNVGPGRVEFLGATPHAEHLAAYAATDIVLDPIPHGGGISTFDALAMGIPVITLRGEAIVGRFTAAILAGMDMEDWIASDADGYVEIAARKANDRPSLERMRTELPDRLARSPAGDLPAYTRATEDAYRLIWREWCNRDGRPGR